MNVITYTRVSTGDQNLDVQQQELTAFIARNGWTQVDAFSDVMSGAKAERPGLEAMMKAALGGGVRAVVVVKLDRLGRSLLNVVKLIDELEDAGVAIICTSQGIDTRSENPCGRVTYQILAAVSEFERNLIRERTKAGIAAARVAGKTIGKLSLRMPTTQMGRGKIVEAWEVGGRKGGLRGLGAMLGGVSACTAMRVRDGYERAPKGVELE